jgi:molybdate transport system substrate-binding protein
MRWCCYFLLCCLSIMAVPGPACAGQLTLAIAADLRYAMDEIVGDFQALHPEAEVRVIHGSSGKFATQIRNGAPFDLYFSADIAYPRLLEAQGLTAGPVRPYARGYLVVWTLGPAALALEDLRDAAIQRIAIANPRHAPYGMRAQEVLEQAGLWAQLQPRLVFGENIAHAAQFVESGAAEAGLVALSLVLGPRMAGKGHWVRVPERLHTPLEQGFVVLRRARDNPMAGAFADYMASPAARAVLRRYGFSLPGE